MSSSDVYAAELLSRVSRMRLTAWRDALDDMVGELALRSDMPELFQAFKDNKSVTECRIRVALRRAYRRRFGVKADIDHAEITVHRNFGKF